MSDISVPSVYNLTYKDNTKQMIEDSFNTANKQNAGLQVSTRTYKGAQGSASTTTLLDKINTDIDWQPKQNAQGSITAMALGTDFREEAPTTAPDLKSFLQSIPTPTKSIPFFIERYNSDDKLVPFKMSDITPDTNKKNVQIVQAIKLQINPGSISMNLSKIINRTRSMTGWVEYHWGEELDTITLQGSTAALIYDPAQVTTTVSTTGVPISSRESAGLAVSNRQDSLTYKQFRNIVRVLSINGLVYNDPVQNTPSAGFITKRYYMGLSYDYALYKGYIESIDIQENEENPYRFIYTITFKSEITEYTFTPRSIAGPTSSINVTSSSSSPRVTGLSTVDKSLQPSSGPIPSTDVGIG